MSGPYAHIANYQLLGLDRRGSQLSRPAALASEVDNFDYLLGTDEGTSRRGQKVVAENEQLDACMGAWTYSNITSGVPVFERLVAGSKLHRIIQGELILFPPGASTQATISILVDQFSQTWVCQIFSDGASVFSMDLGTGVDEVSPVTIEELRAAIDALSGWVGVVVGDGARPAAFLPSMEQVPVPTNGLTIAFNYNQEVNHPFNGPSPFFQALQNLNSSSFELASSIERNNVRYFANGLDEMTKYDGVACYRAGMPKGQITSVADMAGAVGSGTFPDVFNWVVRYCQVDAQGNEVRGEKSLPVSSSVGVNSQWDLVIPNIQNTTGFNTDCALAAGAQSGVNIINVDNGSGGAHTLNVGQKAFFFDGFSATFVERTITAKTDNTITIEGNPVNVTDNVVISANLRVEVYRTEADGGLYIFQGHYPNNSFAASTTYRDNMTDSVLGTSSYDDDPEGLGKAPGLPPKFKYLASYNNAVVGLNLVARPWAFAFSDDDSPESWPVDSQIYVQGTRNLPITGGIEDQGFLRVFKESETWKITGDLNAGLYNISLDSERIGCVSHNSVVRYDTLIAWVGKKSFYAAENGSPPFDIGLPVFDYFRTESKSAEETLRFSKAIGADIEQEERLLFYVPCQTVSGTTRHDNEFGLVFVFSPVRKTWLIWSTWNMGGGIAVDDGILWWCERRYSGVSDSTEWAMHEQLNSGTRYDFVDHVVPIVGKYTTGWEYLGEPRTIKDFLKLCVYALSSIVTAKYSLTVNVEHDFVPGVVLSNNTLVFGNSGGFGSGPFGHVPFGEPARDQIKQFDLRHSAATAIRLRFSWQTFYEEVCISGWQLEASTPYKVAMKQ